MTIETPLRDSLVDRLEALSAATDAARGRIPDDLIEEASALTERSLARRKLSSGHTVVAIAGATGSGKSSTFNALTGLELSAVGV
ncbi:MAG TPA: ABC transporter, partial [Nocardioides sp.]|nr:ABC transporter [Nocardioides sp.]